MSNSEVLIRCEGVSKKFCRDLKRSLWYGVKDMAADLMVWSKPNGADTGGAQHITENVSAALRKDEFWAVEDLNFEVRRGECLGLLGRNGAGKTTLLKLLNGLIKPDRGRIEMKGRVGALIALGAGFNGVLTGRENIYVNGSILGLKKSEIERKFDEIVEFAELAHAIDAPVRTYSSGMSIRLGFAVAAVLLQPEILLLDEVLAVGDIGFTIKCLNAVRELLDDSAVIFVSHNIQMVAQFSSVILLMKNGRNEFCTNDVAEGIERYMDAFPTTAHTSGAGLARIVEARLGRVDDQGQLSRSHSYEYDQNEPIGFKLEFEVDQTVGRAGVYVVLIDQSTRAVATFPVHDEDDAPMFFPPGIQSITLDLGQIPLTPGAYSFVVSLYDPDSQNRTLTRTEGIAAFRVKAGSTYEYLAWSPLRRRVQAKVTHSTIL